MPERTQPSDLASDSEALMQEEESQPVVEPVPRKALLEVLATWAPLDGEFPDVDDLEPIEDVNL